MIEVVLWTRSDEDDLVPSILQSEENDNMIRFWHSWPLASLLALLLDAIHLDALRFSSAFAIGAILNSLVGGLTAAVITSAGIIGTPTRRSLSIHIGYALLSALSVCILTWLPLLLFWNSALSVIGITVAVIIGIVLITAPAFAGMNGEPPHVAFARSIRSPKYGLIVSLLVYAAIVATHENIFFETPFSSPSLAKLAYAGVVGAIWSGALLIRSRLQAYGRNNDMQDKPSRLVVQAAQSIWLGYLISFAELFASLVLPSAFFSWDPIFARWSFPNRFVFAGTTGFLVFAVCAIAFVTFVWRVPLWMHILTALSFRLSTLVTFPWWKITVKHLPMAAAGLAFFALVTAVLHWLSKLAKWQMVRDAASTIPDL